MPSKNTKFVCQNCGHQQAKWLGKCPNCGKWNTLVETLVPDKAAGNRKENIQRIEGMKLGDVKAQDLGRILTEIPELDRVLGGGLVGGQTILLAGEPGIGKSTILSQTAEKFCNKPDGNKVIYVAGEESAHQIKIRTQRLGLKIENLIVVEDHDTDSIVDYLEREKPNLVIVDSIQTLTTSDLMGTAGSVGQVRESASRIVNACKKLKTPVFLVGHVTKEGTVAGPAVLMHIVDTVLWFEGDKDRTLRILRAIKNRFGPTDEVGIFTMEEKGLVSVSSPSALFLEKGQIQVPGSVPTVVMEGTRPILVDIQGLVVPTKLPFPKRTSQGVDSRRLDLLIAVLSRRINLKLFDQDVFVNVAGGIKIKEPAADLAIALAIASSYLNKPLLAKTIAVGELGLLGEVRGVSSQNKRIAEAKRLGFENIASSQTSANLGEAIRKFIEK